MADPRFYDNRGPHNLAGICARLGAELPDGADPAFMVADLAGLEGAGPAHLSFYSGGRDMAAAFAASRAGVCLVPKKLSARDRPAGGAILVSVESVPHAFAAVVALFYPEASQPVWVQSEALSPNAKIGRDVVLGPGSVIGPA